MSEHDAYTQTAASRQPPDNATGLSPASPVPAESNGSTEPPHRAAWQRRKAVLARQADCSHVWDDSYRSYYRCIKCDKQVSKWSSR